MNFEMQKANLLAENMKGFADFVQECYDQKTGLVLNHDKLYQVKSWMEEYKFQSLADEILRINRFEWDEKYTLLLVDRFRKGFSIIEWFVENNPEDLFVLTARMHSLKYCLSWFQHNELSIE